MSVVIPPDASINVQIAFKDLDVRLQALERTSRSTDTISRSDLAQLRADLQKNIKDATKTAPWFDPTKAFRGGPPHAVGFVPDPGDWTGTYPEQLLGENGDWTTVGHGLLPISRYPSTYDVSNLGVPEHILNLLANLVVAGQFSGGDILCNNLTYMGSLTPKPLRTVGYSCSGANSTLDTLIFNDDTALYTLVSGKIQVNTPGLFQVIAGVANTGFATSAAVTSNITKNGSAASSWVGTANSSGTFSPVWPVPLNLVAGDQLGVSSPNGAGSFLYVTFLHP